MIQFNEAVVRLVLSKLTHAIAKEAHAVLAWGWKVESNMQPKLGISTAIRTYSLLIPFSIRLFGYFKM